MAKNIIKGDDLMLFDSQGHSLAYATSHSLKSSILGLVIDGEQVEPANYNVHVSSELDQSTIADKFTNGT